MNNEELVSIELPFNLVERWAHKTEEEDIQYNDFSKIESACRTYLKRSNQWKNS